MAKKNYLKRLPKAGSAVAVAVAMTVALSTQVSATELDDQDLQNNGNPPVDGQNTDANQNLNGTELKETNEAVESAHGTVVDGNQEDITQNNTIIAENNAALSQNGSIPDLPDVPDAPDASQIPEKPEGSDTLVPDAPGAEEQPEDITVQKPDEENAPVIPEDLQKPDLEIPTEPEAPDLPEVPEKPEAPELPDMPDPSGIPEKPVAPEAPNTDGMSVDEHNAAAGAYNDQVDDYNGKAEEYNDAVGEYNGDVTIYNEEADKFNEKAGEYNEDAAEYNTAVGNYNTEAGAYNTEANQYNSDVDDYIGAAEAYNEAAGAYNEAAQEYNNAADAYNTAAGIYNVEADTYNTAAEDYNNKSNAYEQEVTNYNNAVDTYNGKVQAYNDAADAYNTAIRAYNAAAQEYYDKAVQDYNQAVADQEKDQALYDAAKTKYEADLAKKKKDEAAEDAYLAAQENYETASAAYLTARQAYEASLADGGVNADAKAAFEDQKAIYQKAHADYQKAVKAYNNSLNSYDTKENSDAVTDEEFQKYLQDNAADYLARMKTYNEALAQYNTDSAKYQKYLTDKASYDAAYANYLDALYAYNTGDLAEYKEKLDQVQKELDILADVNAYNDQVTEYNNQMNAANEALRENIDVGVKEDLEDLENNDALNEQEDAELQAILAILNEYATRKSALDQAADDLDDHAGKTAPLGSAKYAAYLKAVEEFNEDVDEFNVFVKDEYNQAVTRYNTKVDAFNNSLTTEEGDQSFGQATGTADWGNFADKYVYYRHIDVRYEAAVVKDKFVDDQGNETYSDTASGYEILGVYYDEAAMKANPDKFGIRYVDTSGNTVDYDMMRDNEHNEFCTTSTTTDWYGNVSIDRTDANANKDTVVTFYAKLQDKEGNEKYISVRMDKNSVYADNSYFEVLPGDYLDEYKDSKGETLKKVTIGDKQYYDVSGKPVFLVSLLTCDGYKYNMSGLDLVLNLETMIEIHQSARAQKLGFKGYELEKYKAVEQASNPGEEPDEPVFKWELPELEEVAAPTRLAAPVYDPGTFTPEQYTVPTEPTWLNEVEKLDELEGKKVVVDFEDAERLNPLAPVVRVEELDLIELDGLEKVDTIDPMGSVVILPNLRELGTLDDVDLAKHMDLRTKPVTPPVDPNPQPNPVMPLNDDGLVTIDDGAVPLADVPKTGDASVAFGAMSAFSGFGLAFLQLFGRKKKEEK